MRQRLVRVANQILGGANLKLERVRPRAWDRTFAKWVKDARRRGIDPNDLGDVEWKDDLLSRGLDEFYLPRVSKESVVIELGPGSGRLTRHLIGKARHLELFDYSPEVCRWLRTYLVGKGSHRVWLIDKPSLAQVADGSVDAAFAHGVVEHFDQEVLAAFLIELRRVLKPGGDFVFSFDDLTWVGAESVLRRQARELKLGRFRLYHPEAIKRLGEMFGFAVAVTVTGQRISFAELTALPGEPDGQAPVRQPVTSGKDER